MKLMTVNTGVTIAQQQQQPNNFTLPLQAVQAYNMNPSTVARMSGSYLVVGQLSDVSNGYASYTTIQSAINYLQTNSMTGKILVLPGTYTESLTFSSNGIYVEGCGYGTTLNGTITFAANYCMVKYMQTQSITFNSGTDGNRVTDTWMVSGGTVTNNGNGGNHWDITGE